MKSSCRIKHKLFFVSLLLLVFSVLLNAEELIHKKVKYSSLKNLSKSTSSEFLSEIIEIPINNPKPFIAIGLNATQIKNSNSTHFYLRVSEDKENWSDWQLIKNDNHVEKNDSKFLGTLSFFENNNKFMQFKTSTYSNLKELTFSFISPGETSKTQVEENLKQSELSKTFDGVERPAFVSRKGWGCPQDEHVSSRSLTNVTHLIIHHSAGSTVSSDYAAVVLAYWDYHVNGHGWDDIGYNWLVDPNGVLYKGRAWKSSTQENIQGAHNSGKNGNTAGICFIGHYVSNIPSEVGIDKLASISGFLCDKYGIDPLGKSYHAAISKTNDNITGHGQSGGGTACPGTQIINRMQSIRELTYTKIIDIAAAPEMVSAYPNAEVDSAYHSKKVFVEFTHPMSKSSVDSAFSITPFISGTTSWNADSNTVYFQPLPALEKQTSYTIKIDTIAKSKWDVPLTNDINFSFVTKAKDNLSLISAYPQDGDSDIPNDVTIELQFDGPIYSQSLGGGNISFVDIDSNSIGVSLNSRGFSYGVLKFKPRALLSENSIYSINLKEGIATTDGYTLGLNKTIYFTTGFATSVNVCNIPTEFKLEQNYPNPFNPTTVISYSLPNASDVLLKIYDIIGRVVAILVNQKQNAGSYSVEFDASNLPSGIYFYSIQTDDFNSVKKMMLLK